MAGAPRSCRYVPSARCLHGAETGVGAGIRRRQTVMGGCGGQGEGDKINKTLLNTSVNTDLCAGSEKRLAVGGEGSARTSQQQSRCVFPRRCSERYSPAPPEPLYGDRSRVSCLLRRERLHGRRRWEKLAADAFHYDCPPSCVVFFFPSLLSSSHPLASYKLREGISSV